MLKINEVAKMVGISVRTLHHYDEINLFKPTQIRDNGYRFYSEDDLSILQQILFFKELGFSLKEIKKILECPKFDQKEALKLQRKLLLEKQQKVTEMLKTITKTILELEGEISMTQEEKFLGLGKEFSQYETEAKEIWGEKEVAENNEKLKAMTANEKTDLLGNWNDIFTKLANLRGRKAEDKEVQKVIKKWYKLLNANFGTYSLDAFKGLGQLYILDERFTKKIDEYGSGVAQLMSEAMTVFADNNE